MVKVGDQVTTKLKPNDWGTVIKVGGLLAIPIVDIEYPNGHVEIGVSWGGIDAHIPIN